MQPSRRYFLKTAVASVGMPLFLPGTLDAVERALEPFAGLDAGTTSRTEEFWDEIRQAFRVSPKFINLENGYCSPQPNVTLGSLQDQVRKINETLSYYMRRQRADENMVVKRQLAQLAGCPVEEIVLTRNTTESMSVVIHGLDLTPGDEAIMTNQDYGSMLEEFRQQSRRRGIKCVEISIPLLPRDDEEIVAAYERAITTKTKILLLTHMINVTGQILPARKICDMAHSHGVEVIIDAAHSFAHLVYDIPDLGGDYFGASLHKWLCTPLGAGILQINRAKIQKIWPLFGETSVPEDDIRKFERIGTQPVWTVAAIPEAIRFHRMIGGQRKEERLRYLQQYWTNRVRDTPRVYLNTPAGRRACGIANFGVKGRSPQEVADLLFDRYHIFTVAIDMEAVKGVRVTPHLYTTIDDLDALVSAVREIAA